MSSRAALPCRRRSERSVAFRIDLSFDWSELGYIGERDPEKEGLAGKAVGRLIDQLVADVEKHVAVTLLPALREAIASRLGEPAGAGWTLEIDGADAQTVNFHYPSALTGADYADMAYITPRVKLEFGARGDPWPTEERTIQPYASHEFPDFFEAPSCKVTVLSVKRTFWEKATALHAECHRPAASPDAAIFLSPLL